MASNKKPKEPKEASIFTQPWGTTWRKALVSLPRLVPDLALHFTSPEGPYPIVAKLPSRGKHQIPLYVFVPPSITSSPITEIHTTKSCPVLLDFHGGGFVLGSCQEQAPFCAKLSRELNCVAISVDYRLGPAAQFPAALEDAEDVLNAILDPLKPGYTELRQAVNSTLLKSSDSKSKDQNKHNQFLPANLTLDLDTTRLAISGFSSGGNLALNLAMSMSAHPPLLTRPWPSPLPESHPNPIPFLLFYPSLDTRLLPHERPRPAGLTEPKGFLASLNLEAELMPTYLSKQMALHPRASPGLVSLLPPATPPPEFGHATLHPSSQLYLVLPEHDTLSAQSEAWVRKLHDENHGDRLTFDRVLGVVHGWTQFPDGFLEDDARTKKWACFDRVAGFVGRHWGIEPGRSRESMDAGD